MQLSKFTDYAIRICLYLGGHQERVVPISEIARAHSLSHSSLTKVTQQLIEGGFLVSTVGRSGGIRLARPAAEIRIGDVAQFIEGDGPLVDCETCILRGACGLVPALNAAKRAFYRSLNRQSLADAVLAHPRTLSILQSSPAPALPPVRRGPIARPSAH